MQETKNLVLPEEEDTDTEIAQEVLPIDLDTSPEVVRGELNLKRFSNILFPHFRTKDLEKPRTFSFPYRLPDGQETVQKIIIKPAAGERAYTTYTQRIYYALVILWFERGSPEGKLTFSLRELARRLNMSWSGVVATRLIRELSCLKETNISWLSAFEILDGSRESMRLFNILSDLNYETLEERDSGKRFVTSCYIQFHPKVVGNLLANKVAPVNFTALLSINSSIAEMFYMRIDSVLAMKPFFQWTSEALLRELQLSEVPEYTRNAATRRRLLQKIVSEVDGKPLSTGEIIRACVERTANDDDWKIVCSKSKPTERDVPDRKNLPIANSDASLVDYLAKEMADVVGYPEENAGLYQKLARHYPRDVVYRVLAEFKAEQPAQMRNPGGFFSDKFHRVAHQAGHEWIKECGADCSRRPGNSLL